MHRTDRCVVFDFGEVLSRPTQALAGIAAELGLDSAEMLDRYWGHRRAYDAGLPDEDYWAAVAGAPRLDPEAVASLVEADANGWLHLHPDSIALVEDLAAAGVRMAVLSNAPSSFGRRVEQEPWAQRFAALLFSGDIGVTKPDARIYQAMAQRLAAAPSQLTFFDDRQENVDGARAAGWSAHRWVDARAARSALADLL